MAENTNIFQRALAEILGLPVDLTNSAITGVLKAVGLPEYVIEDPIGGRAWLMDNTGITTDDLQAAAVTIAEDPSSAFPKEVWAYNAVMDAKQRFMERVKQGYSDMLIPDEEIASKELNKGHFGSGWLPDFAENASIMWNRELMRASKTPYTNTKTAPINIDLQTTDFKKAVNKVPEETSSLIDYFIRPANAPTDVWSDAYAEYDLTNLPYIDEEVPRTIKDAQAINSIYYWDGEGEKQIALYKEQLDHFKETSSYSPTHDDSALTQAANWMESAAITGMQINFDEIGGSTTTQLTNAWDNFKAAKTLDEATAALSFVSEVSTAQPSLDFQYDDIVDPHKYTTAGKRFSGLAPVYEDGMVYETDDTVPEQLNQIALDEVTQGVPAGYIEPTTGQALLPDEEIVLPAIETIIDQPLLDVDLQQAIAQLEADAIQSDEQSAWDKFKEILFSPADPTKLGESAYADTMIRDQMADEARKQTALMGTGPSMDIGNLPLSTWGDTPFNMDTVDPAMTNQQILDELTTPVQLEGWRDTYPSQDDLWESDLFPPADTRDLGGRLSAGPQENIFVGLKKDEQDALMTDNNLMTDYLAAREDAYEKFGNLYGKLSIEDPLNQYLPETYDVRGPFTEHEDYYPGHRAAANAAGFGLFNAWGINPAYQERQDALRTLMGVPLGETYTHRDWISTFGPRGVANAADINARLGLLASAGKPNTMGVPYGTEVDTGDVTGGGISVGSGIGEPPSGA